MIVNDRENTQKLRLTKTIMQGVVSGRPTVLVYPLRTISAIVSRRSQREDGTTSIVIGSSSLCTRYAIYNNAFMENLAPSAALSGTIQHLLSMLIPTRGLRICINHR